MLKFPSRFPILTKIISVPQLMTSCQLPRKRIGKLLDNRAPELRETFNYVARNLSSGNIVHVRCESPSPGQNSYGHNIREHTDTHTHKHLKLTAFRTGYFKEQ